MKPVLYIVLLLLAVGCRDANRQTKAVQPDPEITTLPASALSFETETHDFGRVQSGEKLAYSFVFKNTGNGPILIKNAEADCGCITARFTQNQIKPGETGTIEVIFDSAGLFGRQLKTVEILWNSTELKHLIIFAEVENEQIEIENYK